MALRLVGLVVAATVATSCAPNLNTGIEYVPLDFTVRTNKELADRVPDRIRTDRILDIGTDPSYPPMEYTLPDGRITGVDIELAVAIAQTLDLEPIFNLEAFTALESGVRARRFELGIAALSISPAQVLATDAIHYFLAGTRLVRPRNSELTFEDMCGLTIGALEGSIQVDTLTALSEACQTAGKEPITIFAAEDQSVVTQALLDGETAGMVADSPVAQTAVRDNAGEIELTGTTYDPLPYGMLTNAADPAFGVVVLDTVNYLIETGVYDRILSNYGIEEGAVEQAVLVPAGVAFATSPVQVAPATSAPD